MLPPAPAALCSPHGSDHTSHQWHGSGQCTQGKVSSRESWELVYPRCHGTEVAAIILIKTLVGFTNASLRQ